MNIIQHIGAGFISFLLMISMIFNGILVYIVYRLGRMVDAKNIQINSFISKIKEYEG